MTRIVLVHGSILDGASAWSEQEPLEDRYEVVVLERPGSRPGDVEVPMTYADHGAWVAAKLKAGDHLVGHSGGGLVAMLAAALAPVTVASLCVLEPPAFAHAGGDEAAAAMSTALQEVWSRAGSATPRQHLIDFVEALSGAPAQGFPDPLPPPLDHGARRLALEQGPWEVVVPVEQLAARDIPTLVMTGGWSPAMDAIAASLARELGARTGVVAGAQHEIQRAPGFNDALQRFFTSARR